MMSMTADSSSRRKSQNNLARSKRIAGLLFYAVNSQAEDSKLPEVLSNRFPDLIPPSNLLEEAITKGISFSMGAESTSPRQRVESAMSTLRKVLRRAWPEAVQHGPCHELMDWLCIYWLNWRQSLTAAEKAVGDSKARAVPDFSRSMYEVFFLADSSKGQMRFCANRDCQTPHFIKARRRQEYCSLQCAAEGTREAKKRWWSKVGSKRRRKAARKAKKRR